MAYQILMVDDDEEFREELRICLDEYTVIEAANGVEALSILKKPNAIDLVILDAVMPMISGTEVLREIKRTRPSLAIIILTGQSSKDIAIDALKGRADDYIEKPVNIERFLETVRTTLMAKGRETAALTAGRNMKIHQARHFIERNYDKKIRLEDVAGQIYLSPKYFSRVFRQVTGLGFNEFRLSVKMDHASGLLKSSDHTVTEISNLLGYQNVESFIRIFEKVMKMTPSQYRHRHQGRGKRKP